ncbi:MAG: ATP-binding protein [Chloroflexota bacterium]
MNRSRALIDREDESRELLALAETGQPQLAMLYGRRQVGKTFLLSSIWDSRSAFYFLAADVTPELNRRELVVELGQFTDQALNPADFPTWRTVYRQLLHTENRTPRIVILDEFRYLLGGADDAASQLVAVWDREMSGHPTVLVLCGSELSTMERLQQSGSPLYGRMIWSARLHPFDYLDTARMVPHWATREAAVAYGVFGGMPRYLSAINSNESISAAAIRTLISPRGDVHNQLATVIEQESSIREPSTMRAVLAAVAAGRTVINEIAQASGLGHQPYLVRRALEMLEHLEIVARERNVASTRRTPYRYYITDNAVRTWHRFIVPNRGRLTTGEPEEIWRERVEPHLNDHMGQVFERIVSQAYSRFHQTWELPGVQDWARWQGHDRNRRSIEIDIVARLDDGRTLTGEIKWSTQPRGLELHNALQRNLEDLAASGHSWATEALVGPRLYVCSGGFTPELQSWAKDRPDIHLLSLADLYGEA